MNLPANDWNRPPKILELVDGRIDVWRARLDISVTSINRYFDWLSAYERRRAKRYYLNRHRQLFVLRRILLRQLIGSYLDIKPWEVLLDCNPYGKPQLTGELAELLQFNLSFSNNMALFAFSQNKPIGVDIEKIDDLVIDEQIVHRYFSNNEIATYIALPREQQLEAFYNCWTRKEAWIKARGIGLSIPLDSFEVSFAPGEPARLIAIRSDARQLNNWSMCALTPAPCYAATVAVQGPFSELRQFDISL